MLIKKLVSILFVVCLFLSGQVFLSTEVSFALMCCGCGSQSWCAGQNCHCPGAAWHCPWCVAPDTGFETVQSPPPSDNPSANVDYNGISAAVLSSATENVISDIRRNHGRENLTLKLVDNVKYDLKFSCPQDGHDYFQAKRLGFQAKVDTAN